MIQTRRPPRLTGRVVAAVAALGLLAGACSNTSTTNATNDSSTTAATATTGSSGKTGTAPPGTTATSTTAPPEFTPQPIKWESCLPAPFECAWVDVPVDYYKPNGSKIQLRVTRQAAQDPANRIGTLFFNPGGPGASGLVAIHSLINEFSPEVRKRFDVVSWDPRGVGLSAPLTCDRGALDFYSTDMSETHPGPDVESTAKAWAQKCKDAAPELLPFLGTQDVARDLETLRQAVGDDKVTYAGFSYGTAIGLVYAERYPDKVRALILDGVVDPGLSFRETIVQQSTAVDDAFDRFVTWCKANPGKVKEDGKCAIAPDPEAVLDRVTAQAKSDPLPGKVGVDNVYLSTTFVNFAVTAATYGEENWSAIATALAEADNADSKDLAALANNYVGAAGPSLNAAVNCLDVDTPKGDDYQKIVDETASLAPRLGIYNVNTSRICEFWPTPPKPLPATYRAAGSPMIMVWGTTGDNATPYANAVKISGELENARLVTLEASRHAAFGANACVTKYQSDYLINLQVPPPDTKC